MKKLIVLSGFILLNIAAISCKDNSKKDAVAIPEVVNTAFTNKYPDAADVKWKQESDNGKDVFDGDFDKDGKKMEARFDEMGNFLDEK